MMIGTRRAHEPREFIEAREKNSGATVRLLTDAFRINHGRTDIDIFWSTQPFKPVSVYFSTELFKTFGVTIGANFLTRDLDDENTEAKSAAIILIPVARLLNLPASGLIIRWTTDASYVHSKKRGVTKTPLVPYNTSQNLSLTYSALMSNWRRQLLREAQWRWDIIY